MCSFNLGHFHVQSSKYIITCNHTKNYSYQHHRDWLIGSYSYQYESAWFQFRISHTSDLTSNYTHAITEYHTQSICTYAQHRNESA